MASLSIDNIDKVEVMTEVEAKPIVSTYTDKCEEIQATMASQEQRFVLKTVSSAVYLLFEGFPQ